MGDVERQFIINTFMFRSSLYGAVNIDHQIAAPRCVFSGNGVVAEADYIGRAVFTEIFPIGPGDAFVVHENNADFAPTGRCGDAFQFPPKPVT